MAYYAMSADVLHFHDTNGDLLSGGVLYAYLAGTTTPKAMYTDAAGTSLGTSVTLNSSGQPASGGSPVVIWLDDSVDYKFVLKDSGGTTLWTVDDINLSTAAQAESNFYTAAASEGGVMGTYADAAAYYTALGTDMPDYSIVLGDTYFARFQLKAGGDWTSDPEGETYTNGVSTNWTNLEETIFDQYNSAGIPAGYVTGWITSAAADADHDITFTAGRARDDGNTVNMVTTSSITKQIDATWAAGSGAGGMSSVDHPVGNNTWYYEYAISKTDGTTDFIWATSRANALADTAATAGGYTKIVKIGARLTDGSANIIKMIHRASDPDYFEWAVRKSDVVATNPGTSEQTATLSAMPESYALCNISLADDSPAGVTFGAVYPSGVTAFTPDYASADLRVRAGADIASTSKPVFADSNSQCKYIITTSTADHVLRVQTHGFRYKRGS